MADRAYFPLLHEIVQGTECVFNWCIGVWDMQLIQINVVRSQTLQTGIDALSAYPNNLFLVYSGV